MEVQAENAVIIDDVAVCVFNYSGHMFSDFYAEKNRNGSGWVVCGSNAEKYGINKKTGRGNYTMVVARPNKPYRHMPKFNGLAVVGWKTKREAQEFANMLNGLPVSKLTENMF